MCASTVERSGFASSKSRATANFWNWPRTVVTIMCLTANSICEWAGSKFQVLIG